MTDTSIYSKIAERTNGDVYIGVVGPVRSGKSTFIKKFMEAVVIPNIKNDYERERARDEMPQSAGGKTVMTTEPKFIPDEGISISFDDKTSLKVKLVDCVGYMIPEAIGNEENGSSRMVHTPWHTSPVPFEEAAEYGTRKVISEHSTIGILVTSDGTVGDFPRENYVGVEERIAEELTELGKPFAIILNSSKPDTDEAIELAEELEEKYNSPVALVNCLELDGEDIWHILEMVLEEFPAKEVNIVLPHWISVLPEEHLLGKGLRQAVASTARHIKSIRSVKDDFCSAFVEEAAKAVSACGEYADKPEAIIDQIDAGCGKITMSLRLPDDLYFAILSETTGIKIGNETELLEALTSLSAAKKEFDKYIDAINKVNETGYGVVMPDIESLALEEPEIVRQSGGYGIRLKASAPSIHMIKTKIETELNPIVGTEQQSEEMIGYLMKNFEDDPKSIWDSNMFGRSLYELVNDGLHTKLEHMPEDARSKFGETLSRIINEGSQGLICIIL